MLTPKCNMDTIIEACIANQRRASSGGPDSRDDLPMARSFLIAGLAVIICLSVLVPGTQGRVIVQRVVPNKVLYKLNEDASATVWIKNTGKEVVRGRIVVNETRGLDATRNIAAVDMTLAPSEQRKDIAIAWNVGEWMYGRELRADFVNDGKAVSSASEFYQVADQWLRVNMITSWKPPEDLPQDLGPFETYNNFGMEFAWAPDDFSDLTPDAENWYSGQAMYPKSISGMKSRIAVHHAKGHKISTYAKYTFCGPRGFEFARRHPEWVLRDKDGSFFNYSTPLSPVDLARPVTQKPPCWQFGVVDFTDPAAVEYGACEIAASAKMFGWDGVMFDGHFFVHDGYSWNGKPAGCGRDVDEVSVRNTRLCRKIIRQELPNFAFWYNGTYRLTPTKDLIVVIAPGPKTMKACLEDPNSSMLIENQGPIFIQRSWRHWYDWYAKEPGYGGDNVDQKHSVVFNSGWLWNMEILDGLSAEEVKTSREAWVAANHMGSLFLAFNLHPCWNTRYPSRPFAQFMTRHSSLLWDGNIKKIEARKYFRVESSRELWWEKSAYVKDLHRRITYPVLHSTDFAEASSGETLYLLHVLNSPTTDKPAWNVPGDPPAVLDAEVAFQVPVGESVEKAWALRPYEWGEEHRVPVQVELDVKKSPGCVEVNLPSFHYYTLVVCKLRK